MSQGWHLQRTAFIDAVNQGDADRVKSLFANNSELKAYIDEPWFSFDAPAIVHAASKRDRPLIDVLLDAGADIDVKSAWWAGGTSALHHVTGSMLSYDRELAEHLIERGATIDAHAAAGLDMLDTLETLIHENPEEWFTLWEVMACPHCISRLLPELQSCFSNTVLILIYVIGITMELRRNGQYVDVQRYANI